MAQEKNVTVDNTAEETQTMETKVEQTTAPETSETTEAPAKPEKEKKEHPVWDGIKAGAGKVWNFTKKAAPIAGAVVVGVFAGKALGKLEGYENALDKMQPQPDPVPELPMAENVIGVDTVEDIDFGDVTVTDPVPDEIPAE